MNTSDFPESTAGYSTFHPFSRLPPELRLQIWRDTLPEIDPSALTPYRAGCWRPVPVPEEYHASPFHQLCLELEFHPELLDHIRVKMPLTTVNHEARSVAIEWGLKQGIEIRFHEGSQCLIFSRPFDPVRDVMWFNQDVLEDFAEEFWVIFIIAHKQPGFNSTHGDTTKAQPPWEINNKRKAKAPN
ncbi:hypothetical protein PENCOP_c004G08455 [Penicillium coprophilum]|uniref:2EXR domain-containing protein n=1 Tax=Penicillium coprophilum TaxID=36646 RepID=A0A1V6UTR6_9EURO|nr:hypothetical protein PENCOP_c004G08455 [Penicillium coprophilum]